ncbi:hypothetical protein Pmani_022490, partial [Petrolisthes manimaculis]
PRPLQRQQWKTGGDAEWLETILDAYHTSLEPNVEPQIDLEEWSVKPSSDEHEGYLSEQLALSVTYSMRDQHHHAHLLAKLLPQDPFSRAFVIETQFDLREIKFYQEIKPAIEKVERQHLTEAEADGGLGLEWTPELYYSKHTEATESILVLSDMCQRGYRVQDLTQGLTPDQARAALTSLASFHAAAVALQVKEGKSLLERFPYLMSTTQAVDSFRCLVERGLPLLNKFLESRKDQSGVRERLARYAGPRTVEVLQSVLTPSDKLNTLVHCDFWCNNLLFREAEDKTNCCIIDWQMVMHGRPAIDVALLVSTSLGSVERRKHGKELLETYWAALCSRLRKYGLENELAKYTREDLERDYKSGLAMSALVVVGSVDIALGSPAREERVIALLSDLMKEGVI